MAQSGFPPNELFGVLRKDPKGYWWFIDAKNRRRYTMWPNKKNPDDFNLYYNDLPDRTQGTQPESRAADVPLEDWLPMIKVKANLHKFGPHAPPQELVSIFAHSARVGNQNAHVFHVITHDGKEYKGWVPKAYSGHRNILHLLRLISDQIIRDYELKAGSDYVSTPGVTSG